MNQQFSHITKRTNTDTKALISTPELENQARKLAAKEIMNCRLQSDKNHNQREVIHQ